MNETAMEERHGHDVMEMMIRSGKSYTRESLAAEIRSEFGENVTFYTCTADGLSPEGLIDFLMNKGKFGGTKDALYFSPGGMCHGH